MRYATDYPFADLGDKLGEGAPLRECEIIGRGRDPYIDIRLGCDPGAVRSVKKFYVYPIRVREVYLVRSCEDDHVVAAYDNAEAAEEHALSDNPDLATGEDLYSQQVTVYSTTEDYIYENADL